jgi:hypothetical protein
MPNLQETGNRRRETEVRNTGGYGLDKTIIKGPCRLNRKGNISWIPAFAGMTEFYLVTPLRDVTQAPALCAMANMSEHCSGHYNTMGWMAAAAP